MTVSAEGKVVVPSQIRKKWSSDPVYGPEWLAGLRKCDELATGNVETTAAAMAAASSGSGSAATTVVAAEETGAAGELPAEWEAQPASLLDGRTTHTCATEIKGLNLVMDLGDGELDSPDSEGQGKGVVQDGGSRLVQTPKVYQTACLRQREALVRV